MQTIHVGTNGAAPNFVTSVTQEAESAKVTARRVRKYRAHGRFTMTDGTSKPWFDEVSRDLMCLLAVDPSVCSFTPRPQKLLVSIDGQIVEHTPDFQVERISETAIVDVVRPQRRDDDRTDIAAALHMECARRGIQYRLISRETVYKQPRFDNSCELLRFKSVEPTPQFTFQLVELLSRTGGSATRGVIEDRMGGRDVALPVCMRWRFAE